MELIYTFIVCVVISWVLLFIWRERKFMRMCNKFYRDPWNLPGVGNAIVWTQGGEARMKMLQRFGRISIKNGGLAGMWLGPRYFLMVSNATVAEIVLKKCLAKDDILNFTQDLLGYGSIFAPVPIWRPRRKVIVPTFSMKNLNQFVEVFQQQSSILVEQLQQPAGKGTFSIWKYLTSYTMDSVCESTLGVKMDIQRLPSHPFIQYFEQLLKIGAKRLTLPATAQKAYVYLPIYRLIERLVNFIHSFVDDIISLKRQDLAEKEEKCKQSNNNDTKDIENRKSFLELFIKSSGESSGFTNKELREETLVLLLAGTDTSAVGAAFTCLMLARHPDVQEKVYSELQKVLGDEKKPIAAKDLPQMKYLEAVVKESMRLYPPVPVIVRKVEKDLKLSSGQTLVAGTAVMINIWAIHRNPQYWGDDAEEFRPDRFIGATDIHPVAYMPFSHGPRSCLGYQYAMMSMKTAMANLIRNYRIHPTSPVLDKNAPLRISYDVMIKHVDNFQLKLEIRN